MIKFRKEREGREHLSSSDTPPPLLLLLLLLPRRSTTAYVVSRITLLKKVKRNAERKEEGREERRGERSGGERIEACVSRRDASASFSRVSNFKTDFNGTKVTVSTTLRTYLKSTRRGSHPSEVYTSYLLYAPPPVVKPPLLCSKRKRRGEGERKRSRGARTRRFVRKRFHNCRG